MQAKERLGVAGGLGGDLLGGTAERARDGFQDVRQERRLVAPRLRLRLEISRRKVGRVGLEQQPLARDLAHQLEQVRAAALVADPAGDADVQAEVEISLQLPALAREAVGNSVPYPMVFQELRKSGMS